MPSPPLNPIVTRLLAQLRNPEGSARLTRREIVWLAAWAVQREELSPWTKHSPDCLRHEKRPLARRCTCGLEAAEARMKEKRAELLRLIGEEGG